MTPARIAFVQFLWLLFGAMAGATAQQDWRPTAGFLTETFQGAAMAEDPGSRVLRFGGHSMILPPPGTVGPITNVAQDVTQLWDGHTWTTVSGLVPTPGARAFALMAYDPLRRRTVLHGGVDGNGAPHDDTWEWDGAQWIPANPPNRPPLRQYGGMAFDGQQLVLFGGVTPSFQYLDDTWSYDGITWTQRVTPISPPPRQQHGMAGGGGQILVFGGFGTSQVLGDTWRWDGVGWTQLPQTVAPPPRGAVAMGFDPIAQRVLAHGGLTPFISYDTWQFAASAWSPLPSSRPHAGYPYQQNAFHVPSGRWVVTAHEPGPGPTLRSRTWEFGSDLAYVVPRGVACGPNSPQGAVPIPFTFDLIDGQPRPGDSFTLGIGGAVGIGVFSLGWSDTVSPFGALPMSLGVFGGPAACQLLHSAEFTMLLPASPPPQVVIAIPSSSGLVGVRFFAQTFDLPSTNLANLRASRALICGIDVN